MNLAFFCVKAADEGGETPIADTVGVTTRIDRGIKDKFREKKSCMSGITVLDSTYLGR
jgi:hypothetical protein